MLWFNFIFGLNYIFLCVGVKLCNMFDNEFETTENKIKPRIKLNHDIYTSILN